MEPQIQTGFKAPRFADFSPAAFKGNTPSRRDLVEGRLPRGKVVLLAGAGDVGKSFLLLQAFEAINGGASTEAFGGRVVGQKNPCICIMGEDDFASVDLRLKSIRSQFTKIPVEHGAIITAPDVGYFGLVKRDFDGAIISTDALAWLEIQIENLKAAHGDLGFVAIDTFSSLLPVDANRPEEGQATMSLLAHIATMHDVCIIVTHHLRKDVSMETTPEALRTAIRGSTAIVDAVRAAYVMYKFKSEDAARIRGELQMEHDGEVVGLVLVKNNLGLRSDPVTFVRMPDGCLVDVSQSLGTRLSPEDALWQVVREANEADRRINKTGGQGLYSCRMPSWPGGLGNMPKSKIEPLANQLIAQGRLILTDKGLVAVEKLGVASV